MGKYDYLVVGAGLSGAVFAQQAKQHNKSVLVIDKRNHIAGNIYTENVGGIQLHKYGAHIFHTNNYKVWKYINYFATFNNFINSPLANYKGEIYSLPFNMYTFNKMWGVITPQEAFDRIDEQRIRYSHLPNNLEEQAISLVGTDIYNKLIKGYTEKQWGRECKELPTFIINRLPIRFTYDNNYFNAKYQGIPIEGYTKLVQNLLDNIEIQLSTDFIKERRILSKIAKKIIYTGPIDEFFNYSLGILEYRSVDFETESLNYSNFQGNAVVNYTDPETPYTRIIEHKWFTFGKDELGNDIKNTIISREYSSEWDINKTPYYPINDTNNTLLYNKYKHLASKLKNVIFCGRLGEYKYYDMDTVVNSILRLAQNEFDSQ